MRRSLFLSLLVLGFAFQGRGYASSYKQIYSFKGASVGDGEEPRKGNLLALNGVLYGMTISGGTPGVNPGVAFSLTPPNSPGGSWTETVIHSFDIETEISSPWAGLIADANGILYGTGGASPAVTGGDGGVFSLTPPAITGGSWTYAALHYFTPPAFPPLPSPDGFQSQAGLTISKNGILYGTTTLGGTGFAGGTTYGGTVFAVNSTGITGQDLVLYNFDNSPDGSYPVAGLVQNNGGLVGTTFYGGSPTPSHALGCGIAFKLSPPSVAGNPWTETIIHSFANTPDGCAPAAGLVSDKNGVLYGTTTEGGSAGLGTVFTLTPPTVPGGSWTESTIYDFSNPGDGDTPSGTMIIAPNGLLYGTTASHGGVSGTGKGTVFVLTPPAVAGGAWTSSNLHVFNGAPDGDSPEAGLTVLNGVLFGTTNFGGSGTCAGVNGCGTVFAVRP